MAPPTSDRAKVIGAGRDRISAILQRISAVLVFALSTQVLRLIDRSLTDTSAPAESEPAVTHRFTRPPGTSKDRATQGSSRTQRAALVIAALLTRLAFLLIAKVRIGDADVRPVAGRGVIIASNHRSLLDFFVATIAFRQWAVYPHTFARADFFARPVLGRALRLVGAIPAGCGRDASVTLSQACEVLHSGGVITITPEGEMLAPEERTGELGKLRGGIGVMSSRHGTPILLGALKNTDKAWPLDRRTPLLHLPWNRPTITAFVTWLEVQAGTPPADVTQRVDQGLRALLETAEPTQRHS
ncbi:MAG TPA: lysophospholipid acyltransferase family protein [Dermatophilaceae bacterium]